MSRIGKRVITLPKGVEVKQEGDQITVKGPKGEQIVTVTSAFKIELKDCMLSLKLVVQDPRNRLGALYGLYGALLNNAVKGVSVGFTQKLNLVGVGYKAQAQGKKLVMSLGYSHPVEFEVPADLSVACPDQNTIEISGIAKQRVGQFASEVRFARPPEPYKGKGVLREGEKIRRKAGKTGKK
ncbi:MAG: 50S ribosomal protein L6 [Candidatus Caenarcaniphilales bacterium]|nr:50S ribosomal protein L6 [Candidatus Caenarcaniphilales bacterium]